MNSTDGTEGAEEIGPGTVRPRLVFLIALLIIVAFVPIYLISSSFKGEDQRLDDARELLENNNVLGAIIAYQDFIKRYPESERLLEARFQLATCYFLDRDFMNSREVLDEIIDSVGGPATMPGLNAKELKFETFRREGRLADALDEALATSSSLRMADPALRQRFSLKLGQLFEGNQLESEAISVYNTVLAEKALGPERHRGHLVSLGRIAALHLRGGDASAAERVYRDYLGRHPETELRASLFTDLGRLLKQQGNDEGADVELRLAAAIIQEEIDKAVGAEMKSINLLAMADNLRLRGEAERSRALYRQIIDDYPLGTYRAMAMRSLGESLYLDGDVESALNLLDEIVQTYSRSQPQQANFAFRRAEQMRSARAGIAPTTDTQTLAPLLAERAPESGPEAAAPPTEP